MPDLPLSLHKNVYRGKCNASKAGRHINKRFLSWAKQRRCYNKSHYFAPAYQRQLQQRKSQSAQLHLEQQQRQLDELRKKQQQQREQTLHHLQLLMQQCPDGKQGFWEIKKHLQLGEMQRRINNLQSMDQGHEEDNKYNSQQTQSTDKPAAEKPNNQGIYLPPADYAVPNATECMDSELSDFQKQHVTTTVRDRSEGEAIVKIDQDYNT